MVHPHPPVPDAAQLDCPCGGHIHSFSRHLQWMAGGRVAKIGLDLGLPCPHRERNGGCAYCHPHALFSASSDGPATIPEQIARGVKRMGSRYKTDTFVAYFQNETSTFGPMEFLAEAYEAAFSSPRIWGVSVSTRPDCIGDEALGLLSTLRDRYGKPVWIEYGLQSANDRTLSNINRGHDATAFAAAVRKTAASGIPVGVHTILGLPGESLDDMLATHAFIGTLPVDSVKIHHLQICRDTPLATMYEDGGIRVFETLEAYLPVLVETLRRIPWRIKIQRVFADAPAKFLLAPQWKETKQQALSLLQKRMKEMNAGQGDLC